MTRRPASIGGRWKASRAHPVAIPRRTPAASKPVPCITETFDGADSDTIGPDQPWVFFPYASNVAKKPRVQDHKLTLRRSTSGLNSGFDARADADGSSVDHRTRVEYATASTLGGGGSQLSQYDIGAFARMVPVPGDPGDFESGAYIGWHFYAGSSYGSDGLGGFTTFPYADLELYYFDSGGLFYGYAFYDGVTSTPDPTVGDEVAITVTGTGTGTRVLCTYNGTSVFDVSGSDLTTWLSANSITASDLPEGVRGGLSIFAIAGDASWSSANDDLVALDNFSVCPA